MGLTLFRIHIFREIQQKAKSKTAQQEINTTLANEIFSNFFSKFVEKIKNERNFKVISALSWRLQGKSDKLQALLESK